MYTLLADHEVIKSRSPEQILQKGRGGEKRKTRKRKKGKKKRRKRWRERNSKGIFSGALVPYALNSRPPTSLRIFHLSVAVL